MALDAVYTTPADHGDTLPSTTPTFAWTLTGLESGEAGSQLNVAITDNDTGEIIYFQTHLTSENAWTPAAGVLRQGGSYQLSIAIVTSIARVTYPRPTSVPASEGGHFINFTIGAAVTGGTDPDTGDPCGGAITGLRVRGIGGNCSGEDTFPVLRLTWDEIVPCPGEEFIEYVIHRRVHGTETWEQVGTVADYTSPRFDDATVNSGTAYDYSVIWAADASGDRHESEDVEEPVSASVTFDFLWLHPIGDKTKFLRFPSWDAREEIVTDNTFLRAWGRQAPTVFVGQQQSKRLQVNGHGTLLTRPREWQRIEELMQLQREDGEIICARFGKAREKVFCVIDKASRAHSQAKSTPVLELVEVQYSEARGIC